MATATGTLRIPYFCSIFLAASNIDSVFQWLPVQKIGKLVLLVFIPFSAFAEEMLDLGIINVSTSRMNLSFSDVSKGVSIITAEDIAEWAGTIPYEVVTRLNSHLPRIAIH